MWRPIRVLPMLLAGCTPSLAGEWSGEVTCEEDEPLLVEMELERETSDFFTGEMTLGVTVEFPEDDLVLEVDALYDLEVDVDDDQLTIEGDFDEARCRLFASGELALDDCETIGLDVSLLEDDDDDIEDATWDGEVILIDDDGCEGELTRD